MGAPPAVIIKTYPQRGPMQQFRVNDSLSFNCFRCGRNKKSKLLTIYRGDWDHLLCNGCYGRLLSIYEVQAGALDEGAKADALAELLLSKIAEADVRASVERLHVAEHRTVFLSTQALKFLATAEYVARSLFPEPALDWCPAVIGLCKACESELLMRLFQPLRATTAGRDFSSDLKDGNLRRAAQFCQDSQRYPLELGSMQRFLATASLVPFTSPSPLLECFRNLLANWPRSGWLLNKDGALAAIERLRVDFRNKAAHIEELGRDDYRNCFAAVAGPEGLLWQLIAATQTLKGLAG